MPKKLKSIATVATKGGVGKSTLCAHLGVEGVHTKERVLILDTDPQHSLVMWAELRDREGPTVEAIECNAVAERLESAASEGYTLAIIDTAPRATSTLASILRAVDYVLVPLRPSAFDLSTMTQSLAIVAATKTTGAIVLNACPPKSLEVQEMRATLADLSLPLAEVEIGERTAFRRAIASGQAVTEFDPCSKAATEIARLWSFIRKGME